MAYSGTDFPNLDPGEVRVFNFDFTTNLLSGETVSSVQWGCASIGMLDPYAAAHLTMPTQSGAVVSTKVSGFQPGIRYLIQAEVTTSLANVYSLYSHCFCTPPS